MSPPIHAISGLYAITPDGANTGDLLHRAGLALKGGAKVLQYRNKQDPKALALEQAFALRGLTRRYAVPFIVNDDVQLAADVDADGVHIGASDATTASARSILGAHKIIGVSCYNRPQLARAAIDEGADYVAFGAFYASAVKPEAAVAEIDMLRRMRSELDVPIVAIGGICIQNGAELIGAGADALAVISALFDADDIESAAQEFSRLFIRDAAT